MQLSHIHFETRSDKPPVFKFTPQLIESARARNDVPAAIKTTLGSDLADPGLLASATGLVTSNDIMRDPRFPLRDITAAAPHLAWIHIMGAGIEPLLPLDWLPPSVVLTNNSGVHVQKTSEFAAMALLMLNARLPQIITNQTKSHWEQIFTPSISGKTVTVVGLGEMGGAAARQAKRLGLRVIGVRRSPRPHRSVDEQYEIGRIDEAVQKADFIFVAAPLTPESRHLINKDVLAAAKPGAALVNVGRAAVVDYDALRAGLMSGHLSGAILDVFEEEPLPTNSPMWATPNLIMMPHCSSDDSDQYMPGTLDLAFHNMKRLIAGKPLKNRVNPQRGY